MSNSESLLFDRLLKLLSQMAFMSIYYDSTDTKCVHSYNKF